MTRHLLLERLQASSYAKARDSGVVAVFDGPLYDKISSVYDIIFEIHRLRAGGYRIDGTVTEAVFNIVALDSGHRHSYKIPGLEQLPQKLHDLEEDFQTAFPFVRNK